MQIKIDGKPVAEVEVDLNNLRRELAKTWKLEESVKKSIKIIDKGILSAEELYATVYLYMDWGTIIQQFAYDMSPKMKVKVYDAKFKNWTRYLPGVVHNPREYELKELKGDGHGHMLVQSLVANPSFTLRQFINVWQFIYGKSNPWSMGEGML